MGIGLDGVLEDPILALMNWDRGQGREDLGGHGQGEVRFKSAISTPPEMMHIGRVQGEALKPRDLLEVISDEILDITSHRQRRCGLLHNILSKCECSHIRIGDWGRCQC